METYSEDEMKKKYGEINYRLAILSRTIDSYKKEQDILFKELEKLDNLIFGEKKNEDE